MIYLPPNLSDYKNAVNGYILFKEEPSYESKRWIESLVPFPLSLNLEWTNSVLHFASDDVFSFRVKQVYGGFVGRITCLLRGRKAQASQKELSVFFDLLRKNAEELNQIFQVTAFVIPESNANISPVKEIIGDQFSSLEEYLKQLTSMNNKG